MRTGVVVSSAVSRGAAPAPHDSIRSQRRDRLGSSSRLRRSMGATILRASGPARRTTPMPPRPGGVAIATIVSSRFMAGGEQELVGQGHCSECAGLPGTVYVIYSYGLPQAIGLYQGQH